MLALDIETLGLLESKPLPEITCACLFDGKNEYKLLFYGINNLDRETNIQTLLTLLDTTSHIIGFNAVIFDLEFIKLVFSISEERMSSWVRKTIDPFMFLKFALQTTSSLSKLLAMNALPSKIGSGIEAINLALEEKHDELLEYCLMDAKLAFSLCQLPEIKIMGGDSSLKIDTSSGRWVLLSNNEYTPNQQTKKKKRVYPMISGVLASEINLKEVLIPENLMDPEKMDWISMENK